MRKEHEGITKFRDALAHRLVATRTIEGKKVAKKVLNANKGTPGYKIAHELHREPESLIHKADGQPEKNIQSFQGQEKSNFGYYRSNEFHAELEPAIRNLGGIGLAVGSDQGFDLFTMAGLEGLYMIDIDPFTHIVNRAYMEAGARYHTLFGRYPKADEYIKLFQNVDWDVTIDMLSSRSKTYNFPEREKDWLKNSRIMKNVSEYLRHKKKFYGDRSWVGSDKTLKAVIQAYEQGRIHIGQGSIIGSLIPDIAKKLKARGEEVTLIYTSNAPVQNDRSIAILSQLPITDKTKVIFTAGSGRHRQAIPPENYNYAGYWAYVVFRLKEAYQSGWPDLDGYDKRFTFEQFKPGHYRAVPTQKYIKD